MFGKTSRLNETQRLRLNWSIENNIRKILSSQIWNDMLLSNVGIWYNFYHSKLFHHYDNLIAYLKQETNVKKQQPVTIFFQKCKLK